jgi:hypothetical protein
MTIVGGKFKKLTDPSTELKFGEFIGIDPMKKVNGSNYGNIMLMRG